MLCRYGIRLRRASAAGIIDYQIGSNKFDIVDDSKLNPQQIDALQRMGQKLSVEGSTGVAEIIDRVLFDQLKHIVVYPVQDEGQWTDGEGKVLPDALVVPHGITANHSLTRFTLIWAMVSSKA